jgi:hypothetical protein
MKGIVYLPFWRVIRLDTRLALRPWYVLHDPTYQDTDRRHFTLIIMQLLQEGTIVMSKYGDYHQSHCRTPRCYLHAEDIDLCSSTCHYSLPTDCMGTRLTVSNGEFNTIMLNLNWAERGSDG